MAIGIGFTRTSGTAANTTAASGEMTLLHGTDEASGYRIVTGGLNFVEMRKVAEGAYAFCTTFERRIACQYAGINPARGVPTLVKMKLPSADEVQRFLMNKPPLVLKVLEDQGFEFLPETFVVINAVAEFSMEKLTESDLRITFDQ